MKGARRALQALHQQLLDLNVNCIGRGKSQDVQYALALSMQLRARPEAVAALTSRRITRGAALKYAAQYGLEGVRAAVKRYDELLSGR